MRRKKMNVNEKSARQGNSGSMSQRTIDSSQLFHDENEIQIQHAGEIYRLRLTKNGKLILNK